MTKRILVVLGGTLVCLAAGLTACGAGGGAALSVTTSSPATSVAASTTSTQAPTATTLTATTATQATTPTTQPTMTTTEATTTTVDIVAEYKASATTVTWEELMAGVPKATVLKVSGTTTKGQLSDIGGTIHVDGDLKRWLLFSLIDTTDLTGLPLLTMDDIHPGNITLYGIASGEKGLKLEKGHEQVRMFYVEYVEYAD